MDLVGNWNYPSNYIFGAGRIDQLPQCAKTMGMTNPLVVTDPGIAALDFLTDIKSSLIAEGLSTHIFSAIKANPTGKNVAKGISAYNDGNHDGVIAIGGGSAIDAGKAIAVACKQNRPLWDFVGDGFELIDPSLVPPIIAVPTTAGTGSEVGRASVITDDEKHVKNIIFHPKMMPGTVVADPELTVGLPKKLTAATGMDALSHNLEAYYAPSYHPMAAGIAVEGIRLVKNWLPKAVADGTNIEARSHMLVASSMGATAFQRGLGAIHALAHPLGAIYDSHHGMLNAILMPYVLIANRPAIEDIITDLTHSLQFKSKGFTAFLDWVLELRTELEIHHTLAGLGIDDSRANEIGEMAVADPTAGTNPILHNAQAYSAILRCAINGTL